MMIGPPILGRDMAQGFDAAKLRRELQAAQRKAEAEARREGAAYTRGVDRANREKQRRVDAFNLENQRRVDAPNRKVEQHNKKVETEYNRHVDRVNAHNEAV